ncbi:hypothetical protein [Vibrio crassostreae]|uniref:hypothetical protein n=1 Tax=Vibrio crassostreae TaxID=246167 RepID=UPI00104CEFAE|nr:hypothetical protein [Vibrio crassostreae]TCT41977.1 hypothetical protein EDB39_13413 [Vibrio crassostreae]TCT47706.1 hypothetical protein EDB40_1338 [Vibrio crassostreae]CAK2103116.1 Transcriptional regulator [Vibrio crassostreae]CAK2108799.1 Transcriptional regulator [Vibrio crassostreae]CAK2110318.1 Transcriptional regulator [Vibrio crassostreae]
MQSFSEWVESVGGAAKAAKMLNCPIKTVESWVSLTRHPGNRNIKKIEDTLGIDVIDFEGWRTRYLKKNDDYPNV